MGTVLMGVAVAGLFVNIFAFFLLHGGDQDDLNLQGALWHVAGDLLGSVAAIAAAFVIMFTGWMPIDPLLSMLVAALIVFAGIRIALQSAHILIEGVPAGLSPGDIKSDLEAHLPDAERVTHIHAWALTEHKPLVTLEVVARNGACLDTLRREVKLRLQQEFGVSHSTVEVLKTPQIP
jgi:cobalt-zinc-cadmium efflux system protein